MALTRASAGTTRLATISRFRPGVHGRGPTGTPHRFTTTPTPASSISARGSRPPSHSRISQPIGRRSRARSGSRQDRDFVAVGEQGSYQRPSDEPGAAGDDDPHAAVAFRQAKTAGTANPTTF